MFGVVVLLPIVDVVGVLVYHRPSLARDRSLGVGTWARNLVFLLIFPGTEPPSHSIWPRLQHSCGNNSASKCNLGKSLLPKV